MEGNTTALLVSENPSARFARSLSQLHKSCLPKILTFSKRQGNQGIAILSKTTPANIAFSSQVKHSSPKFWKWIVQKPLNWQCISHHTVDPNCVATLTVPSFTSSLTFLPTTLQFKPQLNPSSLPVCVSTLKPYFFFILFSIFSWLCSSMNRISVLLNSGTNAIA